MSKLIACWDAPKNDGNDRTYQLWQNKKENFTAKSSFNFIGIESSNVAYINILLDTNYGRSQTFKNTELVISSGDLEAAIRAAPTNAKVILKRFLNY